MDQRIHQLLLSNDSATDWEYPQGFNWAESWLAVRTFQTAAEAVLGQRLREDDQVQDASFFAELFVFEEGAVRERVTVNAFRIAIRFSAFGQMATVHSGSAESNLSRYLVERLVALLEEHGFVHVRPEALAETYDGVLPNVPVNFTWWLRFFDYL